MACLRGFHKDLVREGSIERSPAADRRPWSDQAVRRSLRQFAADAGVDRPVTPHMLRHSCATLLLEDGVDMRFLQRLLGRHIATTAIYAHVGDAGLRRALESASLLSSLCAEAAS